MGVSVNGADAHVLSATAVLQRIISADFRGGLRSSAAVEQRRSLASAFLPLGIGDGIRAIAADISSVTLP